MFPNKVEHPQVCGEISSVASSPTKAALAKNARAVLTLSASRFGHGALVSRADVLLAIEASHHEEMHVSNVVLFLFLVTSIR